MSAISIVQKVDIPLSSISPRKSVPTYRTASVLCTPTNANDQQKHKFWPLYISYESIQPQTTFWKTTYFEIMLIKSEISLTPCSLLQVKMQTKGEIRLVTNLMVWAKPSKFGGKNIKLSPELVFSSPTSSTSSVKVVLCWRVTCSFIYEQSYCYTLLLFKSRKLIISCLQLQFRLLRISYSVS